MSAAIEATPLPAEQLEFEPYATLGEVAKLGAFFRRDFLAAWSYRGAFFTDITALVLQVVTFWFLGRLINPKALPTYGGTQVGYMEFVASGILLFALVELGLRQVANSIRQEQLMGTLESVLLTPTAMWTIQAGSALYTMVYVPIRTLLFLAMIALAFGVHYSAAGIVPAFLILIVFLPCVWGLGIASAAAMLTFRRGGMGVGFAASVLALGSGAFFPLTLLPGWVQSISTANPMARAIDGLREALIAGTWSGLGSNLIVIGVAALLTSSLGAAAFKLALARERRRGTLGIY